MRKVGSVTLHRTGGIPKEGGIRVRDAVEAFLRYTDKPLVATPDAVTQGLAQARRDRLIGIGRGTTPEKLPTRRCGEYVAIDRGEEGVWIIPPFTEPAPKAAGSAQTAGGGAPSSGSTATAGQGEASAGPVDHSTDPGAAATVSAITIRGDVPHESWTDVFRCFVRPATRLGLKNMKLGIALRLEAQDGSPLHPDDPAIKAMREAARQLGVEMVENRG